METPGVQVVLMGVKFSESNEVHYTPDSCGEPSAINTSRVIRHINFSVILL